MKLEYDDLEKFRRLKMDWFVLGDSDFLNDTPKDQIINNYKRFWLDLGYRYNFQVDKVTISSDTGEVTFDKVEAVQNE